MEQVWQISKENAVALAKAQGRKILLLEGTDYCGYCSEMKAIIASSPIKELVESCFILWYDQVKDGRPVPTIAVIDPAKPDEYLTRTLGRQAWDVLYNTLLKYPCGVTASDPYPNFDMVRMYDEFKKGLGFVSPGGPAYSWCNGTLSQPRTPFSDASIIFTDNATNVRVAGLQRFTALDVMQKLYEKFPKVKEAFDFTYCKGCVPAPVEECIEPDCLIRDIKTIDGEVVQSVLLRLVCKIYGTCK